MTPATAAPPDPALERVHALARALAEREAWTPERVRAHQRTALRSALVHAVAASRTIARPWGRTRSSGR